MTEKQIEELIQKLNRKELKEELIFKRRISKNVFVAKIWNSLPEEKSITECIKSERWFLIQNDSNKFIGAILDCVEDLHWFIQKGYRGKSYLSNALRESIIPYLFDDKGFEYERVVQRITINKKKLEAKNFKASKNVAIKLGFEYVESKNGKEIFKLEKNNLNWQHQNLKEINTLITEERINQLKEKIFYCHNMLQYISDEILMSCGDYGDLMEITKKVNDYSKEINRICSET
ncbi:hypothetical protein [uncultured Wocania sp.]|uniref:GNAT family N-acetyltransferase n=1 Tax=uncultured Wocania sp. TaxID=2834404 RepID=UPI0030F87D63